MPLDAVLLHRLWCHLLYLNEPLLLHNILSFFAYDASLLYAADQRALSRLPLPLTATRRLLNKSLKAAEAELLYVRRNNLGIHWCTDASYPIKLCRLPDRPVLLFSCGCLSLLDRPLACVVGARRASGSGLRITRRLALELLSRGVPLVTGAAVGIDATVLSVAMEHRLPSVCVLPCGMNAEELGDSFKSSALADLLLSGGLILTEYPSAFPIDKESFFWRNRILAGLAETVIITQAGQKSGALLTASHALEQGIEVYVCPGLADDPAYAGCNRLLFDGALPIYDIDTIVTDIVKLCESSKERV